MPCGGILDRLSIDRMLSDDGVLAGARVKLGDGEKAPVRINRDTMFELLGLVPKSPTHRNRKKAAAERHAAAALFGDP